MRAFFAGTTDVPNDRRRRVMAFPRQIPVIVTFDLNGRDFDRGRTLPARLLSTSGGRTAKRLGVRIGNWLTTDQCRSLLHAPCQDTLSGKRDRAILSLLIGCGLRRAELVALKGEDFQLREEHWVIVDLVGKGRHIRTVPVPGWAKRNVDDWTQAAGITTGTIFRQVLRAGAVWGRRYYTEGHLARGEESGPARRYRALGPPRPPAQLR